jgi:capsular polysaccharide biosynthesis protein
VADILPRLFALDVLPLDDIRILVNAPLNAWQQESLELLGFETDQFVPIGEGYVRPEILYLPSFLGEPSPHPMACRWLREHLLAAGEPPRRGTHLYVTRRLARRRRLVNEGQIEPLLRDRGFEVVEAERLTFSDQVRLFAQAGVIAGPHGAGLTNAMFAPASCRILELFQPTYVLPSTYKIATCVGQDYWFLVGEAAPGGGADSANTTDIRIDPEKFEACLDAMLASTDKPSPNGLTRRGELTPDDFLNQDRNRPESRGPSVLRSAGREQGEQYPRDIVSVR